ncbi:MAG: GyrI-like domain-containing protein [bacterium]
MSTESKIDLYKQHKGEYVARQKPSLVKLEKVQYLGIAGQGAPGGDEFVRRIGALYGMAYTIKMTRKFAGKGDYVVCKLECQYGDASGQCDFSPEAVADLQWRLLIRTPDFIKQKDLQEAAAKLLEKGKDEEVSEVALITFVEGPCMQMLHVGPYDEEERTVAVMRDWAADQGYEIHGRHHEIYLSDPRRVAPEKLRTILRLPLLKAKT